MTTVKRYTPVFSLATTLDLSKFGFPGSGSRLFEVWWMPSDGIGHEQLLGTYPANRVEVKLALGVRAVALLRIQAAAAEELLL